jgi:endonuclease/exonuclease/phosphatase family metal-dependent hydrolase
VTDDMTGWWSRSSPTAAVAGLLVGCAAALTASCAVATPPGRPVAAIAAPAAPGSATPGTDGVVRVLQMNLCNSGIAGCYTGRSVAEAAAVIRAEAPDVVTLNEICADDVAVLEKALAETGDAADGGRSTVSGFQAAGDRRTGGAFRCRNGRPFGVGVVARTPGGGDDTAYTTTGGLYPAQDLRDPEERAWLCLRPTGGPATPRPVAACTTHLIDTDPSLARAQCAYLLGTAVPAVRARSAAAPLVLGGDLNLRSGGSPDVRSCVPGDDRRVDDGGVQHVVATPELAVASHRTIRLTATDHPALLVTLTRPAGGPIGPG